MHSACNETGNSKYLKPIVPSDSTSQIYHLGVIELQLSQLVCYIKSSQVRIPTYSPSGYKELRGSMLQPNLGLMNGCGQNNLDQRQRVRCLQAKVSLPPLGHRSMQPCRTGHSHCLLPCGQQSEAHHCIMAGFSAYELLLLDLGVIKWHAPVAGDPAGIPPITAGQTDRAGTSAHGSNSLGSFLQDRA